jgi:hypothetical protein
LDGSGFLLNNPASAVIFIQRIKRMKKNQRNLAQIAQRAKKRTDAGLEEMAAWARAVGVADAAGGGVL